MVKANVGPVPFEQISYRRLLWAGPVTIASAMAANTLVGVIAIAALRPDSRFVPLLPGAPAVFTLFGVMGAALILAAVGRLSRRPIWLFKRIALIVLPITWVPDVLLLLEPGIPGTTVANVMVLMLMHAVAAGLCVTVLTGLARQPYRRSVPARSN
jgi:hypothetical protein